MSQPFIYQTVGGSGSAPPIAVNSQGSAPPMGQPVLVGSAGPVPQPVLVGSAGPVAQPVYSVPKSGVSVLPFGVSAQPAVMPTMSATPISVLAPSVMAAPQVQVIAAPQVAAAPTYAAPAYFASPMMQQPSWAAWGSQGGAWGYPGGKTRTGWHGYPIWKADDNYLPKDIQPPGMYGQFYGNRTPTGNPW